MITKLVTTAVFGALLAGMAPAIGAHVAHAQSFEEYVQSHPSVRWTYPQPADISLFSATISSAPPLPGTAAPDISPSTRSSSRVRAILAMAESHQSDQSSNKSRETMTEKERFEHTYDAHKAIWNNYQRTISGLYGAMFVVFGWLATSKEARNFFIINKPIFAVFLIILTSFIWLSLLAWYEYSQISKSLLLDIDYARPVDDLVYGYTLKYQDITVNAIFSSAIIWIPLIKSWLLLFKKK